MKDEWLQNVRIFCERMYKGFVKISSLIFLMESCVFRYIDGIFCIKKKNVRMSKNC